MNNTNLPAVVEDKEIDVRLKSNVSADDIAIGVCAPILLLAAMKDEDGIKEELEARGLDEDDIDFAATQALGLFLDFMSDEEERIEDEENNNY